MLWELKGGLKKKNNLGHLIFDSIFRGRLQHYLNNPKKYLRIPKRSWEYENIKHVSEKKMSLHEGTGFEYFLEGYG